MSDADHLRRASEALAAASAHAEGEPAARLDRLADQCGSLADRPRGPDHGRLARLLNALSEVEPDLSAETAERVGTARAELTAYREGVEGV